MGKLLHIEVENFKSYKGHQKIGPFSSFTCIIGPNGAGKSNLMDAISFVLGVQSSVLRSKEMKDLIYRSGKLKVDDSMDVEVESTQAGLGGAETAYVLAVIEEDGVEKYFKRRNGSSEFRIDGRVCSWNHYKEVLAEMKLFVKSRNFLVFQGDVEQVAAQTGMKLTKMFEEISGSEEFKDDYDRLIDELEKATENSAFNFNKKRGIQSEFKQCKEQKEQAERFEKLEKERNELLNQICLLNLYKLEDEKDLLVKKIKEKKKELEDHSLNKQVLEEEIVKKKKAEGKEHKENIQKEKELKKKEEELIKLRSDRIEAEELLNFTAKKKKELNETIEKQKQKKLKLEEELAELEKDLKQIETAKKKFEKDLQKQTEGAEMTTEAKEEYEALKKDFYAETKNEFLQLDELKLVEKKMDIEISSKKREIGRLCARLETLENKEKVELAKQKDETETNLKHLNELIKDNSAKLNECETNLKRINQTEKENEERLKSVYENLNSYKHELKMSEKIKKFREAEDSMKRLFGVQNVYGRFVELVRPRSKKFDVAIQTLLGKHLDNILVKDEKVAMECIEFLKQHRVPPMTFIPINNIVVKPIQEKYREFAGCKLAVDLLEFDEMFLSAVVYSCGNAVVCDDLNVARDLCYNKRQKVKAVTLDGTIIHKSGVISVNFIGGSGKSIISKWDSNDLDSHLKLKEKYESELHELSKQASREERIKKELIDGLVALDLKKKRADEDLKLVVNKIASIEKEIDTSLKQSIKKDEDALDEFLKSSSLAAIEKLHQEIADKREVVYGNFKKKYKIKNLPDENEADIFNSNQQLIDFHNQMEMLKNQIQMAKNQIELHENKICKSNEQIDSLDLKTAQSSFDSANAKWKEKQAEIQKLKSDLSNPKREAILKEIKDLKRAVHGCMKEIEESEKEIVIFETRIERIGEELSASLTAYELEEVSIKYNKQNNGEIIIDYSTISELVEDEDLEKLSKKMDTELKSINAEMESLAPNHKAIDKLNEVQNRLNTTLKECDQSKQDARNLREEFNNVKKKRYELFMAAFNNISGNIDKVYKELTKSRSYPTGGTAYLTLENTEEPYLHPIKYHAMPPMKRFRDMDQLSGGEKTMAALALLFAVHSFQPSPFFVLDEIDAALDNHNVQKIARYVEENHGDNFQFIIISLKNTLYQKADSLVGAFRDVPERTSKTVSIDLSVYEE